MNRDHHKKLEQLLERRLHVIADGGFRDRDAAAHLDALREVSQAIDEVYREMKPQMPPRLRHFMEQASYAKALEFLRHERDGTAAHD